MLLILTNSADTTADYLADRLRTANVEFLRLNTDVEPRAWRPEYIRGEAAIVAQDRRLCASDVSHVWFRRPTELRVNIGCDRAERAHAVGEWTAAIEGFLAHVPRPRWMNHPADNATASYKMEQITRAASLGLAVPETIITTEPDTLRCFWNRCEGDVIVKPLHSGYLERDEPEQDSLIYTSKLTHDMIADIDNVLPSCPTLFQRLVRKRCDARITIVDDELFSIGLCATDPDGSPRVDIRRHNMDDVLYEPLSPPSSIVERLVTMVRSYHLRFAAIDMAVREDGVWVFFEINPNGQWAWLDLIGATDIGSGFVRAFSRRAVYEQ